jgi:hypothetical protein
VNTCHPQRATFRGAETISRRLTLTLAALIIVSLGASIASAQVPFLVQPLTPEQKNPGSATFTLTVYGTGFDSDAVVYWNGIALTTTFKTAEELTASVPATDLATAQTGLVTVKNGTGTVSNTDYFQVAKTGYTVAYGMLPYATDIGPQDLTTAQFTSSGHLDLAVATGNDTVSIMLGTGNGTFPTHVQYAVPGDPVAIIHGDFNGDGDQDLVTADQYTSQVSVLLGNGDGTFQPHQEYSVGAKPIALAAGDFNGDGKLDLAVVNYNGNTVSILLGNGDGTFKAQKTYATGNGPSGVAVGDFNGDGKLDLAIPNNSDNTVSILLGNGDGTFETQVTYATAIAPNSIVVGNFTASNILDLAVGTSNKSVSVLLGVGNGTFQNHKEYTIGANAFVVAAADLGSTGHLSLISANYNDNSVSTLGGTGTGTFNSQSVFPVSGGPSGLAIGDFNQDGKLDIAVAAYNANTVSILSDSWITVSPGLVSFGTQTSGEKSAPKTITIKNNGTTAWTMGTTTIVGTDDTDFTISSTTCPASGATLGAGKSCTIDVVFEPTASEVANSQILITTSNGTVYGNVLQGSGNIPITLTPRTQTFPTTLLFTKSKGSTNTFTNDSGVDIYFTLIDLEGVNENDFSFTSTCAGGGPPFNYSVPLLPGASCVSTTYFEPTMQPPGNETTTFVYYGNFTLVKQGLLINGVGTAVSVSPGKITFPNTAIGSTSTKVVTIKNVGTSALAITGAYFTNGTPPLVFGIQSNTCNFVQGSGGSVPASGSCTFTLAFTPTATGTQTATFNIGDSDPTGPQEVSLTGTGETAN